MFARLWVGAEKLHLGGPLLTVDLGARVLIPLLETVGLDLLQETLLALLRLVHGIPARPDALSNQVFLISRQSEATERRSQHGGAAVVRRAHVAVHCLQQLFDGRPATRMAALVYRPGIRCERGRTRQALRVLKRQPFHLLLVVKEQLLVVLEQVMVLSRERPQLLDAHQQQVVVRVLGLRLLQQPLRAQRLDGRAGALAFCTCTRLNGGSGGELTCSSSR